MNNDYIIGNVLRVLTPNAMKDKNRVQFGKIVDILPANIIPTVESIREYYGPKAPISVLKSITSDRLIIKKFNGSYLILPLNGMGRYFTVDLLGEEI